MVYFVRVCVVAIILFYTATSVASVQIPTPSASDPRIKTYVYAPDTVYSYKGFYRYQSSIELEYGEEIQQVAIGDSTGWQITPAGHRLFLKPTDEDATTNMTIYTDKRIYFFELYAGEANNIRDTNLSFVARFVYPSSDGNQGAIRRYTNEQKDEASKLNKIGDFMSAGDNNGIDPLENADFYNFNYTISGSTLISPLKIFDDGEFTYLQFNTVNADIPAIFQVDKAGDESLVNYRISGDYVVIERVSSQFTLRLGEYVTCIFNESKPLAKADAPKKVLGIF